MPKRARKAVKSISLSEETKEVEQKEVVADFAFEEEIVKPQQPGLTTQEWLAAPAVKCLLKRDASTWTKGEKDALAQFLSNRGAMKGKLALGSDLLQQYNLFATELEKITDKEFVRIADPILMSVLFTGAGAMPASYMNILTNINVFNGGVGANTGQAGEQIAFVNDNDTVLHVSSSNVFQQLLGAFACDAALTGNLDLIRLSCTAMSAPIQPNSPKYVCDLISGYVDCKALS